MNTQRGFTLVELIVVVAIIGILAKLGITSFTVYRSDAAYANVQRTMRDLQLAASAGTLDIDHLPGAVALTTQNTAGAITNPAASAFLVGFKLPSNMKLQVSYDPACVGNACVSGWAQVNHCSGKQYMQWLLYGDGSYDTIGNIDGAGC